MSNICASFYESSAVCFHEVGDTVRILIISLSWQEPLPILRYSECVLSCLLYFHLGDEELMSLVPVLELRLCFDAALHRDETELVAIDIFVDGPEAEDVSEVFKIHPEDAVIFVTEEVDLAPSFLCPEWRLVRPSTVPFAAAPGVSQLYQVYSVAVMIKNLSNGE